MQTIFSEKLLAQRQPPEEEFDGGRGRDNFSGKRAAVPMMLRREGWDNDEVDMELPPAPKNCQATTTTWWVMKF